MNPKKLKKSLHKFQKFVQTLLELESSEGKQNKNNLLATLELIIESVVTPAKKLNHAESYRREAVSSQYSAAFPLFHEQMYIYTLQLKL